MNLLHLILLVFQLFCSISPHELGYNDLVLIEEGKSVEIKCLSSIQSPQDMIKTDWYNITLESIDPSIDQSNKVLLENSNPLIVINSDGSMLIENARSEISGYYSCELHYFEKSSSASDLLEDTKYNLYLIEVTKQPSLLSLRATLLIRFYAKSKTLLAKQIYNSVKNLLSKRKHELKSNVYFYCKNVLCQFVSSFNLTKCKVRIKLKSLNQCHNSYCSLSKEDFALNLRKDLNKMKHLLKVVEHQLQKESNELLEFDIRHIRVKAKPSYNCSEGYYFEENRCRPCHSGHYRPIESDKCIACPTNTYNPYFGQSACFDCPNDMTTLYDFEGATLVKECRSQGFSGFLKDSIWYVFSS